MLGSGARSAKGARFSRRFSHPSSGDRLSQYGESLFGLTVNVYGVALLVDPTYPKWLGVLAIVGGSSTMVAGVLIAYTGFSGLAMVINMSTSFLLLVWMLTLGSSCGGEAEVGWMKL
jgi:Domain of unknown function (DUF4386)